MAAFNDNRWALTYIQKMLATTQPQEATFFKIYQSVINGWELKLCVTLQMFLSSHANSPSFFLLRRLPQQSIPAWTSRASERPVELYPRRQTEDDQHPARQRLHLAHLPENIGDHPASECSRLLMVGSSKVRSHSLTTCVHVRTSVIHHFLCTCTLTHIHPALTDTHTLVSVRCWCAAAACVARRRWE